MTWLLGGTIPAKIVLWLLVAIGAGAVILTAKAVYDRNRRREGAREIQDQLDKEARDARDRSDGAAREYRRDGGAAPRLRDGTF
jgi:hypothetical protein